ncbi:hypothetical protein ACEWPB_13750 [Priestia megaterium]|uniref:hypothetical protein n=1 Tax=Priestia megaterium TaxID=1404 RepID=UPI0035CA6727
MLHERKEQERNNHCIECCSVCGERLTSFQEKEIFTCDSCFEQKVNDVLSEL